MRKLVAALVVAGAMVVPVAAQAGWIVEGSIGNGIELKSKPDAVGTNLMVAPGVTFASMLRLELGFLGNVANTAGHSTFELRPMLVVAPPVLPLYGRIVVSTKGPDRSLAMDLGGAVGISFSLAGFGVFGEVGYVPRTIDNSRFRVLEARVGTYYMF